jgi:hypothetical protein
LIGELNTRLGGNNKYKVLYAHQNMYLFSYISRRPYPNYQSSIPWEWSANPTHISMFGCPERGSKHKQVNESVLKVPVRQSLEHKQHVTQGVPTVTVRQSSVA